ncbi:hypothetical protein [Chitinophaga nivalis]|uniref:DUF4249 family protein n=1 Tax=Chitinophaga nivalis TaxID=2991709 RepID=A0ABT3INH7_9BACT|nr:hypothetical protein [Chitinophaga nivalis]MCW3464811.1 hypothetical protein [Chitinophaga nivalis]MCW3485498.1 hypothetical protein [Chitinophaga nivalis]
MKTNIQSILRTCFGLCWLFLFSCKKGELAVANPPKIVNLVVQGYALTDTLEFLKAGKVIGQTDREHSDFERNVLVQETGDTLLIRKKGQSKILDTRIISPLLNKQAIRYYFDSEKIYPDFVTLPVKGFAQADTLEFVAADKVIGQGIGAEFPLLYIGLDATQKQVLQIRKKGTTTALIHKEITTDMAASPLVFYYDGAKIFDKITVTKPANPANMTVIASFTNKVGVYQGPIDLIFYKGKLLTSPHASEPTTMRFELPADGSFSKMIELPALPPTETFNKNAYTFRIVKRGTLTDLPYDMTNEYGPSRPESGFLGFYMTFNPGEAAILVVTDQKIPDDWDGTIIRPHMEDIGPNFK